LSPPLAHNLRPGSDLATLDMAPRLAEPKRRPAASTIRGHVGTPSGKAVARPAAAVAAAAPAASFSSNGLAGSSDGAIGRAPSASASEASSSGHGIVAPSPSRAPATRAVPSSSGRRKRRPESRDDGHADGARGLAPAGAAPSASEIVEAEPGDPALGSVGRAKRKYVAGRAPVDREIRRLQKDHRYLSFTKVAFARVVKGLMAQFTNEPMRFTQEALATFQAAAEEYLMYLFADAYLATNHRRCVTLNAEDLRLVRRLRMPHCWGETI